MLKVTVVSLRHYDTIRVKDTLVAESYGGRDAPDDAFSRSEALFTSMLVALMAIGAAAFVSNDAERSDVRDRA